MEVNVQEFTEQLSMLDAYRYTLPDDSFTLQQLTKLSRTCHMIRMLLEIGGSCDIKRKGGIQCHNTEQQ